MAETQNNLCIAYSSRILGNPARNRNLKLAIIHGQLALQVRSREAFPEQGADTQNNLGNAYCERIQSNTIENLWLAVEAYQEALGIYTRRAFPQRWARTQNNLGTAYSELRQITLAIECFRSALEIYSPTAFPVDCLIAGRNFGFTAYQFGDMDKAIEGYGVAIEAGEESREWVSSDSRKEEILSGGIDVYGRIVQAYLQNNQLDKAIEYVERSKARNLVGLLADKNIYPKRDLYPNPDTYQTIRLRIQLKIFGYKLNNGLGSAIYHLCQTFAAVKYIFKLVTHYQIFDFPKLHSYGKSSQII